LSLAWAHLVNPWTTIASRVVYENAWIRVREDQVVRPDGLPGIYGVVHYRNKAVGVLPVEPDGDIWLVGQHRYPLDQYSWEIPEGGCPEGEDLEACALRELEEETGLRAELLEPIATVHLSNSVSDEWGIVFRASRLHPGTSRPEGTEQLQVRRVAFAEAEAMLAAGQITDSLSVIALLHEGRRRRSQPQGRAPHGLTLKLLPGRLAITRLDPSSPTPAWAATAPVFALIRTVDQQTLVASEQSAPPELDADRGWRAFQRLGPCVVTETRRLDAILGPLSAASLPVLALSTFETDLILVREADLDSARHALTAAGLTILG
jgi:8-oxo-dGTP pyrophosphatase MutT (NUDIX family)